MTDEKLQKPESKGRSLFKSAMAMSTGTLLSRVLGFIRDALLAAYFSKTVTDAFIAAFRLPNMFRRLFGEGALAVSFIPIYVEHIPQQDKARALANSFFTVLSLVTATLSVLGVIFMDQLIPLVLSGDAYSQIEGKLELTINLARIMFSYLFLVTSFAYFSSMAQAHRYFLIPALGPALFNLIFIIFCFFPQDWFLLSGGNLAWAVIAGGVVQAGLVLALLFKIGHCPKPSLNWGVSGVGTVIRNTLPGIIGMGVVQIMSIINLTFLSRLEEGAISYFFFADRILEMPQSLIAISLGAALLPQLSQLWSEGRTAELLQTSNHHLKLLLFLALPSAVGMFVLAQPIIETLFSRGEFSVEDASKTAQVVRIYSVLLIMSSLNKVLVPNIYAIKNTWLPATITSFCLLLHILVAPYLIEQYGLKGLAYSMTMAAGLNTLCTFISVRVLIGKIGSLDILITSAKNIPSLIVMAGGVYMVYEALSSIGYPLGLELSRVLSLALSILAGVALYFVCSKILKNPYMDEVVALVKRRRKNS